MVRWLHISDLHIAEKADWNNFEKELIKKCQEYDNIDLVIVTGDFHNFMDGDDFHLATVFLKGLLQSLHLDIEKDLFVVPGNHDGVDQVQNKNIFIRSAKSNPFEESEQWVETLSAAFQSYENFVRELIPHYPVEHPASIHSRTWRGQINFIHCNTALAADGKVKTEQLLDIDGLSTAKYLLNMPNILLAHNCFLDLHLEHQSRVQDTIRINSVCAYFCGDRHEQSVDMISIGGDDIPCVVSYRGAPDPMDCYSTFGVIFGEWEREWAELKGWCWKSGQGFSKDEKITGKRFPMRTEQAPSSEKPQTERVPSEISVSERCQDEQVKEFNLKHRFIKGYYHMTRQQYASFNRRHGDMPLLLGLDSVGLSDYVKAAQEKNVLEQLVQDMTEILTSG